MERAENHLGLLVCICAPFLRMRGYKGPVEDSEEFSIGSVALVMACQKFDPTRGFQFSTYASVIIKSHLRNQIRKLKAEKRGLINYLQFSGPPDDQFESRQDWIETSESEIKCLAELRSLIKTLLSPLEIEALEGRIRGEKFKSLSLRLGITKQGVHQAFHRAVTRLKEITYSMGLNYE